MSNSTYESGRARKFAQAQGKNFKSNLATYLHNKQVITSAAGSISPNGKLSVLDPATGEWITDEELRLRYPVNIPLFSSVKGDCCHQRKLL